MLPDNLILRLESSMEMIPNSSTLEHFQDNTVIICEINRVDRNSSVTTCFLPSYHSKIKSQGEDIRNLQNQNQILNDLDLALEEIQDLEKINLLARFLLKTLTSKTATNS
jgi:hypothetical protein